MTISSARRPSWVRKALDELSKLGMLGLLLAGPAVVVWGVRTLLRRAR